MHIKKQIVKVAIDVPINDLFDYICEEKIQVGQYVVVPFGARRVVGVAAEIQSSSDLPEAKLKKIIRVDQEVLFDAHLFKLFRFVSQYYQYPIGQTIHTALPSRLKKEKNAGQKIAYQYTATPKLTQNIIDAFSKRQKNLIKVANFILSQATHEAELRGLASNWKTYVNYLQLNDLVIAEPVAAAEQLESLPAQALNQDQTKVVEVIEGATGYQAFLIHGITGSGKTEVYMHLIENYLKHQGQVLVLVPEINLTPQLENRFKSRFQEHKIVSLHSHLSDAERLDNWRLAKSGEAQIVIGTRLSIFTPFNKLKAIIIDEEHDLSFKQQDNLRYHARDVAMMRAKFLDIPIVLGSATPSLEVWHAAKDAQKMTLLTLPKRAVADALLPKIDLIKMDIKKQDQAFSEYLLDAIRYRLIKKQQSLIFINRRGFAPVLFCVSCGWHADCERCSSRLVVHKNKGLLQCHHCDYKRKIDQDCQQCGNMDLMTLGVGTQKIEEQLAIIFPDAKIQRVDRDTIKSKKALDSLYDNVHKNKIDILVGTQMLSKGHDFPNLTLVGILNADHALYSSDFRSAERLFSQLVQVAGRSGRAKIRGEVIIQTNFTEHPTYQAVQSQDYQRFADEQLQERKELDFPPFIYQAVLRAESKNLKLLQKFMQSSFEIAKKISDVVEVFQPVRPYMEKINGFERANIYFHAKDRVRLNNILSHLKLKINQLKDKNNVKWHIDVDPIEF
jgi:primosomal protein N' (replication factor Y)